MEHTMSVATITNKSLVSQVDNLGKLKAKIATLQAEYDAIKNTLVEMGIDEAEGKLFKVTVSTFDASRVDYKAIVEKVGCSSQMLTANTSHSTQTRVSVKAR